MKEAQKIGAEQEQQKQQQELYTLVLYVSFFVSMTFALYYPNVTQSALQARITVTASTSTQQLQQQ